MSIDYVWNDTYAIVYALKEKNSRRQFRKRYIEYDLSLDSGVSHFYRRSGASKR